MSLYKQGMMSFDLDTRLRNWFKMLCEAGDGDLRFYYNNAMRQLLSTVKETYLIVNKLSLDKYTHILFHWRQVLPFSITDEFYESMLAYHRQTHMTGRKSDPYSLCHIAFRAMCYKEVCLINQVDGYARLGFSPNLAKRLSLHGD